MEGIIYKHDSAGMICDSVKFSGSKKELKKIMEKGECFQRDSQELKQISESQFRNEVQRYETAQRKTFPNKENF